jgi:hypothetical protein
LKIPPTTAQLLNAKISSRVKTAVVKFFMHFFLLMVACSICRKFNARYLQAFDQAQKWENA